MNEFVSTAEVKSRHQELQQALTEASLPLADERPEVMEWYEERRIEARNSLMEFVQLHRHELPQKDYRYAASHVVVAALRRFSEAGHHFAETLDRRLVPKPRSMQTH